MTTETLLQPCPVTGINNTQPPVTAEALWDCLGVTLNKETSQPGDGLKSGYIVTQEDLATALELLRHVDAVVAAAAAEIAAALRASIQPPGAGA